METLMHSYQRLRDIRHCSCLSASCFDLDVPWIGLVTGHGGGGPVIALRVKNFSISISTRSRSDFRGLGPQSAAAKT